MLKYFVNRFQNPFSNTENKWVCTQKQPSENLYNSTSTDTSEVDLYRTYVNLYTQSLNIPFNPNLFV